MKKKFFIALSVVVAAFAAAFAIGGCKLIAALFEIQIRFYAVSVYKLSLVRVSNAKL